MVVSKEYISSLYYFRSSPRSSFNRNAFVSTVVLITVPATYFSEFLISCIISLGGPDSKVSIFNS